MVLQLDTVIGGIASDVGRCLVPGGTKGILKVTYAWKVLAGPPS